MPLYNRINNIKSYSRLYNYYFQYNNKTYAFKFQWRCFMECINNSFKSEDGVIINYNLWKPDNEPKAILQICHGLAEHINVYHEFAEFLNKNDILVVGNDHRGHGRNITKEENMGYFSDADGWSKILDDTMQLTSIIKNDYKDTPYLLFGHSMGSFIARSYIQESTNDLDGIIICGTGGFPKPLGNIGIIIAKSVAKLYGKQHHSKLLDKLSFGSYNDQFKPNRTSFDWLTRLEERVDGYIQDPLRGFVSTSQLYIDLLTAIKSIDTTNNLLKTDKDFPILIISGDLDPVGDSGKYIVSLYNEYKQQNYSNVHYKLYSECRHELLNEINRYEIMEDILKWIKVSLKKKIKD